jgi:hypothetical protein
MDIAIRQFFAAHEQYLALEQARTLCRSPQEREQMHIAILRAYLEVQRSIQVIAGRESAGKASAIN